MAWSPFGSVLFPCGSGRICRVIFWRNALVAALSNHRLLFDRLCLVQHRACVSPLTKPTSVSSASNTKQQPKLLSEIMPEAYRDDRCAVCGKYLSRWPWRRALVWTAFVMVVYAIAVEFAKPPTNPALSLTAMFMLGGLARRLIDICVQTQRPQTCPEHTIK